VNAVAKTIILTFFVYYQQISVVHSVFVFIFGHWKEKNISMWNHLVQF